jgi:iron complex outermembrane receptor protein
MTSEDAVRAKHKINRLAAAIAGGAGLLAIAASSPALAQTGSSGGARMQLEEVVVTAQRRAEIAQDTALAISVMSGNALGAAGVTRPEDLTLVLPGLQVSGGTNTQIYVRGIGNFGATAVATPAVVTSIDGVVIGRPQGFSGNLYDIERVELLKGPQGTLYGRNASGGVLNVITRKPELAETGGYLNLTAGNYDLFGAEGALNVGVGETTAYRLAFQVNRRDGYLSDGTDDDDRESFRFQARFEPNERLSTIASVSYTSLGGKGTGLVRMPKSPGSDPWAGNTSAELGDAYLGKAGENFAQSGGQSLPPLLLTNPRDFKVFQDTETYAASLELNYAFDWATLTVLPGWRKTESRFAINPAFLYNVGGVYNERGDKSEGEDTDQYSLEVRLANETDSLKWVVGAFWFNEEQDADYTIQAGMPLNIRTITSFETDAYAVFGQATYSFSPRFRVTGGLRWTSDERSVSDFERYAISPMMLGSSGAPGPADCAPYNGVMPGELCTLFDTTPGYYDGERTSNEVTWKIGFEVDLTDQSLLYFDVSESFKAGGFNQAVSFTSSDELLPFETETVRAYSIGSKNRFLDNRLQLNAELFYYDWDDMQISSPGFDGDGYIMLMTRNAGGAEIKGVNLDLMAVPWNNGTLRMTAEYVDGEYDDFRTEQPVMFVPPGRVGCPVTPPNMRGQVTVDCSGMELIRTPEWTVTAGLEHIFDLPNGGTLTVDGNLTYGSATWVGTDFHPDQRAPEYTVLNSSVTYTSPNERYFVSAWMRNITEEEVYTGGGGIQSPFVTGWAASSIAPPRTYGVRVGMNF